MILSVGIREYPNTTRCKTRVGIVAETKNAVIETFQARNWTPLPVRSCLAGIVASAAQQELPFHATETCRWLLKWCVPAAAPTW